VRFLLLVAFCLLVGCSSDPSFELADKWSPLKRIEQSDHVVGGGAVTIFSTLYVRDLKRWLVSHPEGYLRDSLLLHEQIHARQELYSPGGFFVWFPRYLLSPEYRWEQERPAYEVELRCCRLFEAWINADEWAKTLSGDTYEVFGQKMISFDEAKAWVKSLRQ
jgi:hypothetical protein